MIMQETTQELTKEFLTRLDALADKLGTTADYLWIVLVKQAQIEAIESIFILISGIGTTYFTMKLWWWLVPRIEAAEHEDGGWIFLGVISSIVSIVLIISSMFSVFSIPTKLLNPEYWALQEIMKVLQ